MQNASDKYIHIFRRNQHVCVLNTLTLEKVYLVEEEYERDGLGGIVWKSPVGFEKKGEKPRLNNLQIAVTTKCNFLCRYCQLKQNENPCKTESMSSEAAQRIYEKYEDIFNNGTVMITGGEPLLNWDVTRFFIGKSKKRKIIFTNASLVTPEIAQNLAAENVFVIASLDGPENINDFSRMKINGESTYSDIIKGIECLKKSGCRLGVSLVLQKHNMERLSEVCEWIIREIRPLSLGVNVPHYTKKYSWEISEAALVREFLRLYDISKKYNIFIDQISRVLTPIINEKLKIKDCSACGTKAVVYPDENISNCIVKYLYTNGNNLDIWSESSPLFTSGCQDCCAIGICGGGCKFDGEMYFGEGSFDLRRCLATIKLTERILWDIFECLGVRKPSTEQMLIQYKDIMNNPLSIPWSVGHDL